jgi:hypothetical protein
MNLWRKREKSHDQQATRLKHDIVIGPQRHSDLFGREARLYYCVRCKWSFLVCGSTVAVLDENQNPVTGEESLRRFNTFAVGPCPVLESFASAALTEAPWRSRRYEPGSRAPNRLPAWSAKPRPLLRVLTRAR